MTPPFNRRSPSALVPAVLVALLCLPTSPASAQGTREDYDRATALRNRLRVKLPGLQVNTQWIDGGAALLYRKEHNRERYEILRIDPSTGVSQPAFDHGEVAKRASALFRTSMDPYHLPVRNMHGSEDGHLWLLLHHKAQVMVLRIPPGEPAVVVPLSEAHPFALLPHAPGRHRRSGRGGDAVHLLFVNGTSQPARLYWLNWEGKKKRFDTLQPGESSSRPTYGRHAWLVTDTDDRPLASYLAEDEDRVAWITDAGAEGSGDEVTPAPRRERRPTRRDRNPPMQPGGEWRALIVDYNVHLRHRETGEVVPLSSDGSEEDAYGTSFAWSPDGRKLVVQRTRSVSPRQVSFVESSPRDQVQPRLHTIDYPKPGDPLPVTRPVLFNIDERRPIPIDDHLFKQPWSISRIHWAPDSTCFHFLYNQRGHQVLRVLSVQADTGQVDTVIEERSDTFIDYSSKLHLTYLDRSGDLLWMSERDGWNHLYRIDARTGEVKHRVTQGEWVVRQVKDIDEEQGVLLVEVLGIHPDQDPYYRHLARVGLDGSGFTLLTEGNGTHQLEFSPDRKYYIDTWSRVDLPPVKELRRSADGSLSMELCRANDRELRARGWQPPEPFVARGRDGSTDIYGVIHRPTRLDPSRKYPVIESIYAGPHGYSAPKSYRTYYPQQTLAELGFIVVEIDGMGTNWRSKAFHDRCWKNLGDAGFPDRIAWIKAAAARYPYIDSGRVGIYGGSAGGQNAVRALTHHHDFYRAAVADCGCHDNRMDKVWWNEQWMGWPIDEAAYDRSSNVTQAHRLEGHLLLTVGELDRNVDPASTMQVVHALIEADKDFELIVFPGEGHGAGSSAYGMRRMQDFFVRHLLGAEPRR